MTKFAACSALICAYGFASAQSIMDLRDNGWAIKDLAYIWRHGIRNQQFKSPDSLGALTRTQIAKQVNTECAMALMRFREYQWLPRKDLPTILDKFEDLVAEYNREIYDMGYDPVVLIRGVDRVLGALLTPAQARAMAHRTLPDVPDNHWMFETLQRMKKYGMFKVGYVDGLIYRAPPLNAATMAPITVESLGNAAQAPDVLSFQYDEDRLIALTIKLCPEISATGANPVELVRHLKSALRNSIREFPDVPKSHWAANDLLELRKAGVVHGYPDGKFRG